jgi:single-stranded-DNA-specific exonuclease
VRPEWTAAAIPAAAADLVAAGLTPRLAALLSRRGVSDAAAAARFLAPDASHLHDPFLLPGMSGAVDLLVAAGRGGGRIAVVGDYDVDGVTSMALLLAVLRSIGFAAEAVVPHRLREGYGFQSVHVDTARELGCTTIVTVDCGTTAVEAVAYARQQGLEVVITDHHLPGEALPVGAVLVNPRHAEGGYPFLDLAGVGLALKLATALLDRVGKSVDLTALLRIAALGTIADLVPLRGENRVIAALGLAAMPATRSRGLRALMQKSGLTGAVRAGDVGFKLGPRLNAAGRLDSAERALRLLLTRDEAEAEQLAAELDDRNRERQHAEMRAFSEALESLRRRDPLPAILVDWSPDWHKGVVGIAAGRVARELNRPTVLLAASGDSATGSWATGSGRSVPGIDLHGFLAPWQARLERFGGHAQAIGMTAAADQLDELRQEWEAAAAATFDPALLQPRFEYELEVAPGEVDRRLLGELVQLEPCGQANPQPLLRVGPLERLGSPRLFGNDHLRVMARGERGSLVSLLGWGFAPRAEELGGRFEVLGHLEADEMRGGVELRLLDVRPV